MKLVPKPEFPDSPLPTKYEWGDEVTKLLVRGLHTDLVKEGPPVGASCGTESFPPVASVEETGRDLSTWVGQGERPRQQEV